MASFLGNINVKALLTRILLTTQVHGTAISTTSSAPVPSTPANAPLRGLALFIDKCQSSPKTATISLHESNISRTLSCDSNNFGQWDVNVPAASKRQVHHASEHHLPKGYNNYPLEGPFNFTLYDEQAEYKNVTEQGSLGMLYRGGDSIRCGGIVGFIPYDCPPKDGKGAFSRGLIAFCSIDG